MFDYQRQIERWEGEGGRVLAPEERIMTRPESRNPSPVRQARLHSVLVPIDFTPASDRVLGRLSLLPLADHAEVILLHVVPNSLSPREQQAAARDADKALANEAHHLRKMLPKSVRVHTWTKLGGVAKEIASCATTVKADLIVMGRGAGRALRDAFLGSTAERVVRHARLPVLVVRLAPRATYRRPAVALDLDLAAHEVVRLMLVVLSQPRPRVTAIHAHDVPHRALVYPSLSRNEAEEMEDDLQGKAAHKLARLLATAVDKANVPPEEAPDWKTLVRYGSPRVVVEKAARRAETDLLVLGTRGYTGAAYVVLGTVAGELLREAKCDVLVVPPAPARA